MIFSQNNQYMLSGCILLNVEHIKRRVIKAKIKPERIIIRSWECLVITHDAWIHLVGYE